MLKIKKRIIFLITLLGVSITISGFFGIMYYNKCIEDRNLSIKTFKINNEFIELEKDKVYYVISVDKLEIEEIDNKNIYPYEIEFYTDNINYYFNESFVNGENIGYIEVYLKYKDKERMYKFVIDSDAKIKRS